MYYRGAGAAIVVYDITREVSLVSLVKIFVTCCGVKKKFKKIRKQSSSL